jgi:hypothetical protein
MAVQVRGALGCAPWRFLDVVCSIREPHALSNGDKAWSREDLQPSILITFVALSSDPLFT